MSELSMQRLLAVAIVLIFGVGVAFTMRASTRGQKWLGLFFLIACSENVLSFPASLLGFPPYSWMLGNPDATRYLWIVLLAFSSMGCALLILGPRVRLPRLLDRLPPLGVSEASAHTIIRLLSGTAAALALIMSATGYYGYYMSRAYLYAPPTWIDAARAIINVGQGLSFIAFWGAFAAHGRMRTTDWILVVLWLASGAATGFKTFIVLPFFFIGLAAWLEKKFRLAHLALFATSFVVAYTLVSPLRELRFRSGHDNALKGIQTLYESRDWVLASPLFVIEAALRRVDNTVTALQAIEADRYGRVDRFRERLREMYSVLPLLPFVPRALWPGKPMNTLGRELSIAATGNPENAITPSTAVASWFWLGWLGVVINSLVRAYLLVVAMRLVDKYMHRPLDYAPVGLLLLAFSVHNWLMPVQLVSVVRSVVLVVVFYVVARSVSPQSKQNFT